MPIAYQTTSISYTHSSGTSEQTVFTFTPSANNIVKGIWLDTTNLTQNNTIRVKYQIDGTNYRTFQTISWNTTMDDGILIEGDIPVAVSKALRVTMQSGTTEGANISISGEYWTESNGGAGAVTFTYTVTNSITSAALGNVEVWVTSDSAGSNIIASGITNSSGQIIFYLSNNTTYYFWRKSNLYTFTNPDQEDVAV